MLVFYDMDTTKAKMYKTARATISCAEFKTGDFVAIKHMHMDEYGVQWFEIEASQHGPLNHIVAYPEHHLSEFCL